MICTVGGEPAGGVARLACCDEVSGQLSRDLTDDLPAIPCRQAVLMIMTVNNSAPL